MKYDPKRYIYDNFKKLLLADISTKEQYDLLAEEFELIAELIRARKEVNKTQKDIAKAMRTSTSFISRLESISGSQHSPTVATLKKYALSVGCKLSIKLIPLNALKAK